MCISHTSFSSEFPLRPQGQILRLRTTFSFTQETKCIEMKYIVQREKNVCAVVMKIEISVFMYQIIRDGGIILIMLCQKMTTRPTPKSFCRAKYIDEISTFALKLPKK